MIVRFLGNWIRQHYWKNGIVLLPLNQRKHFEDYKKVVSVLHSEKGMLQTKSSSFATFSLVKKTAKLNGLLAELGVFEGRNAQLICNAKGNRKLLLFDTWNGLPTDANNTDLRKGDYKASLEKVKERLKNYSNVEYRKGLIQDTLKEFENEKFSFVFLDLDLGNATTFALQFLYSRMCVGGIIATHNYSDLKDIQEAFDEFFVNRVEIIHEVGETIAFIQKC